ncbi:Ribosomal protein S18 acetylase RimI [Geodermatophilus amargosae]|uniref:Ribosomal protein S18 acetylase RimI n=1 Tax=Geodermatophilus amargosae TaxID=1296565 RepID=A0A1I7CNB0_9ACTN|nr:GNAT family N-acetyltransferase [Geodermatophilus amargosae]SFU00893.1 Ribosomal protein S18 acetylase RimI [Geodermatophilus amargosae]
MVHESGSTVRPATAADRAQLARILTAAFADDPVFSFLFPPVMPRREARVQRMFALEARRSEDRDGTWLAEGAGAAVWFPPGRWRSTTWEDVRDGPRWVRLFGRQLRPAQEAGSVMESHHRLLPDHWYLLYVGIEPGRQGRGLGSALLRPVLAGCDRTGTPAYLEASCERNRSLYARHGFVERDPLPLTAAGPTVFPMWRDPA